LCSWKYANAKDTKFILFFFFRIEEFHLEKQGRAVLVRKQFKDTQCARTFNISFSFCLAFIKSVFKQKVIFFKSFINYCFWSIIINIGGVKIRSQDRIPWKSDRLLLEKIYFRKKLIFEIWQTWFPTPIGLGWTWTVSKVPVLISFKFRFRFEKKLSLLMEWKQSGNINV